MSKLKSLVADAIKSMKTEIDSAGAELASNPAVSAPADALTTALKGAPADAQRAAELGLIIKTIRGGAPLLKVESDALNSRIKAVGVTTDIAELLPSGFTGTLWQDIQSRLVVTALFPFKQTSPGQYDSIAVHGIEGFLTNEATDGTDSAESYITMIYLVSKCMAVVRKSYEALDDALIDLATEVRNGIVDALARAIEQAVINGDDTATHMDAGVAANSYKKAFKGLRKLGLGKQTVDFGGAALAQEDWLKNISAMQEAGGVYLDDLEVSMGNVVILVDQNSYNQLRMLPAFLTRDKAAGAATLFGSPVDSVFNIPVVMTPYLPQVDATGVVGGTADDFSSIVMVNRETCVYYATGTPLMEIDRNIVNQHIITTGSVRAGFNSRFDRLDSNPTAIDATRKNIVVGINVNRI